MLTARAGFFQNENDPEVSRDGIVDLVSLAKTAEIGETLTTLETEVTA